MPGNVPGIFMTASITRSMDAHQRLISTRETVKRLAQIARRCRAQMLELNGPGDSRRCLVPAKQFVSIGSEKTSSALGQQVQSDCALRDRKAFQFRQHRFTQSLSTMRLTNDYRTQQQIGPRTLEPSISYPLPIHFEPVKLSIRFADITEGQSCLAQ